MVKRTDLGIDLYLMRHGEAGTDATGKRGERTLTISGQREIKQIAEAFSEMNINFDIIAASPLKYAGQTAAIISKELKHKDQVETWEELRPDANRKDLYLKMSKLKGGPSILLVGHEPFLSNMIIEIISDGDAGRIVLKKGGISRIRIMSFHPRINGELRWLLSPKIMKKLR